MASYYRPIGVVLGEDIVRAAKYIQESGNRDDGAPAGQLGSEFNQWQKPVTEFGRNNPEWEVSLKASPYIGEMDFGRREWARSRDAVDAVMELLQKELRVKADTYEHLRIDSYIRQGSSRDGLKVVAPDEFDTVIEFHIEGLKLAQKPIYKTRKYIPGFCYLRVEHTAGDLEKKYPKLWRKGVFQTDEQCELFLSSRRLHQEVFESLIDQSCRAIEEKVRELRTEKINFHITRRMNPPSVNITIHLDKDDYDGFMRHGKIREHTEAVREIDLDIVPAIRLNVDVDTRYGTSPVNAVIHAVCKWKEEDAMKSLEFANQIFVWHINSAGYERYTLDVARTKQKQRYILTALRILKTYFSKTKSIAKSENQAPPQITTVLKSYHLKQVAFYLILYSCHIYPSINIDGAQQALKLFLALLETSLKKRHLPHFFYSNSLIRHMFPNYPMNSDALRFDLFRKISEESLRQAEKSYADHLVPNLGLKLKSHAYDSVPDLGLMQGGGWAGAGTGAGTGAGAGTGDADVTKLIANFSKEINMGDYF